MKSIILMFIAFFFFCCSLKTEKNVSGEVTMNNNADIEKIIFHHVDLLDIFTTVNIPCEVFERVFVDIMQRDTITEPNEIALIKTYVDKLRRIDSLSIKSVDTRAKIYFMSPLDTTEYCIDGGIVYSDGVYYETSKELFDYIENVGK